nr:MAG TPA: Hint module [Caudoviricetes sp.]
MVKISSGVGLKNIHYELNHIIDIRLITTQYLPDYYIIPQDNQSVTFSIKPDNDGGMYVVGMPTTVINAELIGGGLNQRYLDYRVIDINKPAEVSGFAFQCLIAGTLITLANGDKKPVEYITYDDDLLVWDFFNGCFASAKPRWIKIKQTAEVYNKLTFDNGATLGLVGEGGTEGYHRIFNKQANMFTHTGVPETPNGTITFAEDQSEPVLLKQELIHENVDYYNIIADKHFNLFANGILTSCRCSNLYKIENMKYVGDRTMSDKEVDEYFKRLKNLQLAQ